MPTYTIYGYNERTPFAETRAIIADDLPSACRAADAWFPDGCVTCAIPSDRPTTLPAAWFTAKRRQLAREHRETEVNERDEDDREPRRPSHCDYSDASALECGPRG